MDIAVIGGGIGGLALAAGLRRKGFGVSVFERDIDVGATGGYHITLDGRAQVALQTLIAPDVFERLLAAASALRLREPDAWWDRRGRLLGQGPDLGTDPGIDIDRITLRTVLADAVGADLCLGHTVAGVGRTAAGEPVILFADGSQRRCDVLVGADGSHSVVARYLAGAPTNTPAGIVGVSGRTRQLDLDPAEQKRLGRRSGMAMGPGGAALYVGFLDPVANAVLHAPDRRDAITRGPTYIWGAMFPDGAATDAMRDLHGTALQAALIAEFRRHRWGDRPLDVIARADPESVAMFRFNAASSNPSDLAPWPAGRITALGDAVHATPPTAGMGAGAAIRDAESLVRHLCDVAAGTTALPVAIGRFEADMRVRGAEVLIQAMRTVRWILTTDTAFGAPLTVAATGLLAVGNRFRRRR